jgi:hypothetical protein
MQISNERKNKLLRRKGNTDGNVIKEKASIEQKYNLPESPSIFPFLV